MSTLRLTTISNQGGTATVPSETVINGSAKAWVNFNGTGTVAIRASFNVSSITDNGTGDYTTNFTNALTDANYSVTGSSSGDTSSHYSYVCVRMNNNGTNSPSAFQTSSIRFIIRNDGGANTIDTANISLSVFR